MTPVLAAAIGVAVAVIQSGGGSTAPPVLSSAVRSHLRAEAFSPITTVGALPPGVRGALRGMFREDTLVLAEPGAPFQATDVVIGKPLPWRRMIAAGCSSDHCVVYYERGGIAHVYTIVVFTLDGDKARLEFGGAAHAGLAGIEDVKNALVAGKVIGQTRYW